jgi:hypothetical protein
MQQLDALTAAGASYRAQIRPYMIYKELIQLSYGSIADELLRDLFRNC